MESIERLRTYARGYELYVNHKLLDIADAIEREVDEMWHALTIDAKPMTDENMAESGWVRLPMDADGIPIHVGDVMEWDNGTFTVHELKVTEDGWTTWDEQHGYTVHVDVCHHHAPTVEDVLREFALAVCKDDALTIRKGVVEEYAKRLTLAEGSE